MKIICIGGGPAGLYFALLMKKLSPAHDITVVERNRPYDTFGWGVVFSDATMDNMRAWDRDTADTIEQAFNHWDDIELHFKGRVIRSGGHGFVGIGRKKLLMISLAGYVIFGVACALVKSFDQLIVMRVLQGLMASGLMVLPGAIIRDQFEGDAMARVFSLISAVFITVPVIAPSIGQAVMEFAGWRWLFVGLGVMGTVMGIWAAVRLPETLHPEFRQEIQPQVLARNMWIAATSRAQTPWTRPLRPASSPKLRHRRSAAAMN